MKDLFVPYELAVKLKDKGFNDNCLATYVHHAEPYMWTGLKGECKNSFCNHLPSEVTAPLWQQVIDWLREEKELLVVVDKWRNDEKNWCYAITKFNETNLAEYREKFDSYYSALQSGIEKALELI